jgi:hypothetical protein
VFTKILGATIGAILTVASVASANGDKLTRFTIRVENITEPEAFTASNGVKWSLALSALLEITQRHLSQAPPWRSTDLGAHLGVSSLESLVDEFVRAGILLRSADPERWPWRDPPIPSASKMFSISSAIPTRPPRRIQDPPRMCCRSVIKRSRRHWKARPSDH